MKAPCRSWSPPPWSRADTRRSLARLTRPPRSSGQSWVRCFSQRTSCEGSLLGSGERRLAISLRRLFVHSSILVIALVALATSLSAQLDVPIPVQRGLDALRAGRPDSAAAEWTRKWTSADDSGKREQLIASLQTLARVAGPAHGFDVVRVVEVTAHLRWVYVLLLCERQPAYLMLVVYRQANEWRITAVNWNTDADKVLPEWLIASERPTQ
jgi:hypothetical protein